jgi:hypothetical protein
LQNIKSLSECSNLTHAQGISASDCAMFLDCRTCPKNAICTADGKLECKTGFRKKFVSAHQSLFKKSTGECVLMQEVSEEGEKLVKNLQSRLK